MRAQPVIKSFSAHPFMQACFLGELNKLEDRTIESLFSRAMFESSSVISLFAAQLISVSVGVLQIEFLFRDATQYTGLTDCQSPRKEAIHIHINASLIALTLLKLEDRIEKRLDTETVNAIDATIHALSKACTVISIAHHP